MMRNTVLLRRPLTRQMSTWLTFTVSIGIAMVFVFLFGSPAYAQDPFTEMSITLPDITEGSVAWGDYDQDGDLDILVTGMFHPEYHFKLSRIYRNDGGSFSELGAGMTGVIHSDAEWGDYDNDGDLDVLLTGFKAGDPDRISALYRNDGGTVFSDIGLSLPGTEHGSVAWGDYDQDGDLDFVLTGEVSGTPNKIGKLYRNNGSDSFTEVNVGLPLLSYGCLEWGDYDNDGDLDLLASGNAYIDGRVTRVYRNDSGAFIDIGASLEGLSSSSGAWGDYDNDGDLDILVAGYSDAGSGVSRVYANNAGSFANSGISLTGLHAGSASWGDYDNDGNLDILLTGRNSSNAPQSLVYRNDGGSFTNIGASLANVDYGEAAWGDYDNDGDLDILLTGEDESDVFVTRLYRNDITAPNTAPDAPTSLQAEASLTGAALSWAAASDGQTPVDGLSYNLRVGSNPGLSDVLAPMALDSGYRQVSQLGNAQQGLTAMLSLPVGTYYWSVQAVDSAWVGSPFAAEGAFIVSVSVPLDGVSIGGPDTGFMRSEYVFTATTSPASATMPISYQWDPAPSSGQGTAVASYSWRNPGTKTIAVTATNPGSEVSDTHQIEISNDKKKGPKRP